MEITLKMGFYLIMKQKLYNLISKYLLFIINHSLDFIITFIRLGATRHMIQVPQEDTMLKLLSQNKNLNDFHFLTYENIMYDITRPRLLIKDFLVIRYSSFFFFFSFFFLKLSLEY